MLLMKSRFKQRNMKVASLFECHLNINLVSLFVSEGANQILVGKLRSQTHGKSDVAKTRQSFTHKRCHHSGTHAVASQVYTFKVAFLC